MIEVTLRDYFAGKAMQALIENDSLFSDIPTQAYEMADAMIVARRDTDRNAWLQEHPAHYLSITVRIVNALRSQNIDTMEKLLATREFYWLTRVPNMGVRSVEHLKKALAERGLELRK
jgi:DNA-directed RNA polymerase alpha subunit